MNWNETTRVAALTATLSLVALVAPAPAAELGVPTDGLDRVLLDDGRVLSCRHSTVGKDRVSLEFPAGAIEVAASRVKEIRRFADFDSTPRDNDEKEKVEKGLVRWEGRWVPQARAEAARKAQEEKDAAARLEDEAHATWETRRNMDTEHFHFESDIPKAALDEYAVLMEAFYDYFTKAFKIQLTQRERRKKLPVYLFRRRDDFRKFHDRDTQGKSEHLLGYFMPAIGQERLVFFDLPGNRQETVDVMFHETTHFLIHLAEPTVSVSRWVHEGMAEYIGKSRMDGKRFIPGGIQDDRLLHFQEMIQAKQFIPIETMLKAGNAAADGEHVEFEGEHYAETWTLVHFLLDGKGGKYRNAFIGFLDRMMHGKGVKYTPISGSEQKFMDFEEQKAQLLRALGMKTFEPLERELKEYAMELPLEDASAYVRRGEINLYNRGDMDAAQRDWAMAEERGKDNPKVLLELARVYGYFPNRQAEAVALLTRALELDPLDVTIRYRLGRMLPDAEGLRHLRLCTEIDPGHSEALADLSWRIYTGLSNGYKADSDEDRRQAEAAAALAERAVANEPTADAYFTLASLRLVLGQFDKARDAAKIAVEMDPEAEVYLWRLAEAHALLGEAPDFAKLLRRIELLLRRGPQIRDGETAAGRDEPPSPEDVAEIMARLVRRTAERCLEWEKKHEASLAAGSWFERRPPKTEDDWGFYATVVFMGGDRKRSARIAADGLKLFPDSELLKPLANDDGTSEGVDVFGGEEDPDTGDDGGVDDGSGDDGGTR